MINHHLLSDLIEEEVEDMEVEREAEEVIDNQSYL